MDAIYVDAESHGYYGDDEPPESVVLVGEGGSIEYVPAGEYHWLRDFLNGIAAKCGTKDCPSLVEYVRQLEVEADELRELVRDLWEYIHIGTAQDGQSLHDRTRELGIEVDR